MAERIVMILALLCCCLSCETNLSRDKEIWVKYQPMIIVGRALRLATAAGETLPDSHESLEKWTRVTPLLGDENARRQAEEFCRRGVYRTNLRDNKGRQHDQVAMYHIVVRSGSLICTYGSADGWSPKYYPEKEARSLFGEQTVDTVIARGRT